MSPKSCDVIMFHDKHFINNTNRMKLKTEDYTVHLIIHEMVYNLVKHTVGPPHWLFVFPKHV